MHSLSWLKEKVVNKLEGWKGNLLNQAGKETPIKAVIQAIPSYLMAIPSLPKTFCDSLTAIVAKFWWKTNDRYNGIHWKKFEALCSPKSMGGLGFKEFNKLNSAFCQNRCGDWPMNLHPIGLLL